MRKLPTGLTAAMLAATIAAAGAPPANAAPLSLPKAAVVSPQSDVIPVDRRWRRGYYNGYQGYSRYRSGYRYYDGLWFPAGAFVAGALIGGAIANSNYYGGGYYGGYYGNNYYGGGYYPSYYRRYYEPAPIYYPPRSSYRQGYRDGYRDGYYARRYGNDITCTARLQDAGKC